MIAGKRGKVLRQLGEAEKPEGGVKSTGGEDFMQWKGGKGLLFQDQKGARKSSQTSNKGHLRLSNSRSKDCSRLLWNALATVLDHVHRKIWEAR